MKEAGRSAPFLRTLHSQLLTLNPYSAGKSFGSFGSVP